MQISVFLLILLQLLLEFGSKEVFLLNNSSALIRLIQKL
jgi:hypothetical protein